MDDALNTLALAHGGDLQVAPLAGGSAIVTTPSGRCFWVNEDGKMVAIDQPTRRVRCHDDIS